MKRRRAPAPRKGLLFGVGVVSGRAAISIAAITSWLPCVVVLK
jgi:hypothetical protein